MKRARSNPSRRGHLACLVAWVSLAPWAVSHPQSPSGTTTWAGHLRSDSGEALGLRLRIEEGTAQARFTVPHLGWYDLRAPIQRDGTTYRVELPAYSERAVLSLVRSGNVLEGRFHGWGTGGTAHLQPSAQASLELTFEALEFGDPGDELEGTLVLPKGNGPFPAVVWTHGSGTVTREDPIYRSLALWLVEHGIAALIYDKRPPHPGATMQVLAADAVAGVHAIQGDPRIRSDRVGVGGMSQGGWISPMAAALSEEIAFVVGLSAPGISPGEQNLFNQYNRVLAAGFDESAADEADRLLRSVYAYLRTGENRESTWAALEASRSEPWHGAAYELPIWLRQGAPPAPWKHVDALDLDPGESWMRIDAPVVCVWGSDDRVVPSDSSRRSIEAWLEESGNTERLLLVLEGAHHDLRPAPEAPWSLGAIPPAMNAVPRFIHGLGAEPPEWPPTRRGEESFELHGRTIPDPFRWFEDAGEETERWARAQDELTRAVFADDPLAEALGARMLELNDYSHAPVPRVAGGRWFTGTKPAQSNYIVPRVQTEAEREDGFPPRILVDPHAHPAVPGESVALGRPWPSPDGRYAYLGASSPSMPSCVRIVDVETGEELTEEVIPIQHHPWRVAWMADARSLVYADGERVRVHVLGTPPNEDPVIFGPRGEWNGELAVHASSDGRWIFVTDFHPTQDTTRVHVATTDDAQTWRELFEGSPGRYQVLGTRGSRAFFYTTLDAPNGRIIALDLDPEEDEAAQPIEIAPEQAEAIYDGNHPIRPTVGMFGGSLVALYSREGRMVLRVWELDGRERHVIEHREFGFVESGLLGHPDVPVVRYDAHALFEPGTAYELNLMTGERHVLDRARMPFDPKAFEIHRRAYRSFDGTSIPIYLAHRKGLVRDGTSSVLIPNAAVQGIVVRPTYLPSLHAWIEMGGVLALPGGRGSGEYGVAWHLAGKGRNKGVGIDDLGAAADWLARAGYSRADRIGILGSSMGAAPSAGAFVRYPDSFGAALMGIPKIDLLAWPSWVEEYGDFEDPDDFAAMIQWLPLQNAVPRIYPPVLVQVGSIDRFSPPYHGYKLVATLQEAQRGAAPVHLQVSWGVGHAQGIGVPQRCEVFGVQFAFLARSLGLVVD